MEGLFNPKEVANDNPTPTEIYDDLVKRFKPGTRCKLLEEFVREGEKIKAGSLLQASTSTEVIDIQFNTAGKPIFMIKVYLNGSLISIPAFKLEPTNVTILKPKS